MAMLASAIPFILDMIAMKKLHPRVFGILLSASPAVSALAGWLILDERLNSFQVLSHVYQKYLFFNNIVVSAYTLLRL